VREQHELGLAGGDEGFEGRDEAIGGVLGEGFGLDGVDLGDGCFREFAASEGMLPATTGDGGFNGPSGLFGEGLRACMVSRRRG